MPQRQPAFKVLVRLLRRGQRPRVMRAACDRAEDVRALKGDHMRWVASYCRYAGCVTSMARDGHGRRRAPWYLAIEAFRHCRECSCGMCVPAGVVSHGVEG